MISIFCRMLCVALLALAAVSNVQADPRQDNFDLGVQASKAGNFATALQYFKEAKKAGLYTPALQYNLAVCYYKLGQYETARKIFTRLTDVAAFEQLAYFNLGLIANKQKDEPAAIRWFQRAYRDVSSRKVQLMAKEALKRLNAPARKTRRDDPSWGGFVSSSLAYDSNVALVNDDLIGVTSESDTLVDVSASAQRWLKGNVSHGVRMSFGASLQKYNKLGENDYAQLNARVMRYNKLGEWSMRLGGSWNEIYFNGSEYQRIVGADMRSRTMLSGNKQLRLRYKLNRIQATDAIFDYLDGWRQQFRIGINQATRQDRLRYYYQLEINNRKDREGTVDPFISYSPMRHTLRVTAWWNLGETWRTRLDGRYRYSRYRDENILQSGATQRREDSQVRLSARIGRTVARYWDATAQLTLTENDSNVDRKGYDRSVVKLSVSRFF